MIHAIKTPDEPDGRVIVHRRFEGEHDLSETCWCRPEVIEADEDSENIVERLERVDG